MSAVATALPPQGEDASILELRQRNLHQRIAAIMADCDDINPTGQNAHRNSALSIGDVERAVRPLLARHGVVIRFRHDKELGGLVKLDGRDYRANLIAVVENADNPADAFEEAWCDEGGSPAAAYSYTRKSYIKGLLHLAEDGDERAAGSGNGGQAAGQGQGQGGQRPQQPPAQQPQQQRPQGTPPRTGQRPATSPPTGAPQAQPPANSAVMGDCPDCGPKGVRGTVMLRQRPPHPETPFFCSTAHKGCDRELAEPVNPTPAAQALKASAQATPPPATQPASAPAPATDGQQPARVVDMLTDPQKDRLKELHAAIPRDRRPSKERFAALIERGYDTAERALAVMGTLSAVAEADRPSVEEVDKAIDAGVEQAEAFAAGLAGGGQ